MRSVPTIIAIKKDLLICADVICTIVKIQKYLTETPSGQSMLDTYAMVSNEPTVYSYPFREEDLDGEWQPGLGNPVNPTMAKRPVPMEMPFYDYRGNIGAQVLDQLGQQGLNTDPFITLDKEGYNPRQKENNVKSRLGQSLERLRLK